MRGNEHSDVTAGGWTIREKGFAVVTSSQAPLGFETDALMHEIGHFYQVLHHNGGDNYTTAQRKESNPNYDHMCIYGDYFDIVKDAEGEDAAVEVRSHIYETLPLCGGCKDLISYHATDYDHS